MPPWAFPVLEPIRPKHSLVENHKSVSSPNTSTGSSPNPSWPATAGNGERLRVFLDTETTHLSPGQIAQLSYIVADDEFNVISTKNHYFAVETMSKPASEVNGLNKRKLAKLSGGLAFADRVEEIDSDLKDYAVICQNADFDLKFMHTEYTRACKRYSPIAQLCTMRCFTPICKLPGGRNGDQYKWPSLQETLNHAEIDETEVKAFASQVFRMSRTKCSMIQAFMSL